MRHNAENPAAQHLHATRSQGTEGPCALLKGEAQQAKRISSAGIYVCSSASR